MSRLVLGTSRRQVPLSLRPGMEGFLGGTVMYPGPVGIPANSRDQDGEPLCPQPTHYLVMTQGGSIKATEIDPPEGKEAGWTQITYSGALEYVVSVVDGRMEVSVVDTRKAITTRGGDGKVEAPSKALTAQSATLQYGDAGDSDDNIRRTGSWSVELSRSWDSVWPSIAGQLMQSIDEERGPSSGLWPLKPVDRAKTAFRGRFIALSYRDGDLEAPAAWEARWLGRIKLSCVRYTGSWHASIITNKGRSTWTMLRRIGADRRYRDALGVYGDDNWEVDNLAPSRGSIVRKTRYLSTDGSLYRLSFRGGVSLEMQDEDGVIATPWTTRVWSYHEDDKHAGNLVKIERRDADRWTDIDWQAWNWGTFDPHTAAGAEYPILIETLCRAYDKWGYMTSPIGDGPQWEGYRWVDSRELVNHATADDYECDTPLHSGSVSIDFTTAYDSVTGQPRPVEVAANTESRDGVSRPAWTLRRLTQPPPPREAIDEGSHTVTSDDGPEDKYPSSYGQYGYFKETGRETLTLPLSGYDLDGVRYWVTPWITEEVDGTEGVGYTDFRLVAG